MAGENDNLLEGLLSALGDNPQEKISEILGSLTQKNDISLPVASSQAQAEPEPSIDMGSLLKIGSALSSGGTEDDNTRLLSAIKPFLNDKRKPQVDSLLKLLKLANVAQKAGGMDILKNLKL